MKKIALILLLALCLGVGGLALGEEAPAALAVYFSRMGNTDDLAGVDVSSGASFLMRDGELAGNAQLMAEWVADQAGCELFEIQVAEAYPASYDDTIDAARTEQRRDARPVLATAIGDFERYDTLYLVYPNWWGDLPMALYSFFDAYDCSGKTLCLFVTHGGSGFSRTVSTIQALEPDATVVEALSVRDDDVPDAEQAIRGWVAARQ